MIGICDHCLNHLPYFRLQQLHGDLLNWPAIHQILPDCHFDQLICITPYCWPIKSWLLALKYQQRADLASLLAQICFDYLNKNQVSFDPQHCAVVSVPISFNRWLTRSYNQAHLIAKPLSIQLNLPYIKQVVNKQETSSQVGRTALERRHALKNTFELNHEGKLPEHIILVDDIVTTGSTCSVIAQLLKSHGVTRVTVIAMALSLPQEAIAIDNVR
jgi:ComF family protein